MDALTKVSSTIASRVPLASGLRSRIIVDGSPLSYM